MDIVPIVIGVLYDNWESESPEKNDVAWRVKEFDLRSPQIQVLVENYPSKSTWIAGGIYRIEHNAKITIYHKLISYDEDRIDTFDGIWFSLKEEIDRILTQYKFFFASGVINSYTSGWDDRGSIAVGRGDKTIKEPIVWKSEQIVTLVYYSNYELIEEEEE